jgi:site-specific DNA-methyltransferase (adenine-specific)
MKNIPDKSVDMILCDLPYGTTNCKWDTIIPFKELWEQYNRVIKADGAIVLFSAQPFTTKLITSNFKQFRYCWYWLKNQATGFTFAKYQPMRKVEDIVVFYNIKPTYNPQGLRVLENAKPKKKKAPARESIYKMNTLLKEYTPKFTNYPKNVLEFNTERGLHPTQKPVLLLEYLIKTYSNEGEIVLDNCMGSGSTGVACVNTGRKFIGIELDIKYFDIAKERIDNAIKGV